MAAPGGALVGPDRRVTSVIAPVRWTGERLVLLDQTLLPGRELEREYTRWEDVAEAMRALVVRGAPAIGVAAAFGVALAARQSAASTGEALLADLETAIKGLASTRPTAVNLFWALERMRGVAAGLSQGSVAQARTRLAAEAEAILAEDVAANRALGDHGAALVPSGARILTHCNAGALATAGYGTALGIVRSAHARGRWRCCGWTRRARSCRARGSPPGSACGRGSRTA